MTEKDIPRIERIEKVWTPDAKLWTPHSDGEIAFAFPSFGPGNYRDVGQKILSHGLKVPTGDYTASLVHSAFCNKEVEDEEEFVNVRNTVKRKWLWVYNIDLFTDKGIYVLQDLKAVGRSQSLDVNCLERILKGGKEIKGTGVRFSKDGLVRFAPRGSYKLGEHTHESFALDGFMIASCDADGSEKLGEVSTKFRNNPYVCGVEVAEGQAPQQYVSALSEDDEGVRFLGYGFDGGAYGLAFGVFR